MIVTIDGPAGAGKSSIARELAERLGFEFLDTGAMYRAVTLRAMRHEIEWTDSDALVRCAGQAQLGSKNDQIFLDGEDVSEEIRTPDVTAAIHYMADLPEVRKHLSKQQRRVAIGRDFVTEGRDQGSEVFPDAECKIFLTASSKERARRRQQQLARSGRNLSLEEILEAQNRRDAEDEGRPLGALRPADDAIVLESDGMTAEDVIEKALSIVERCAESTDVRSASD